MMLCIKGIVYYIVFYNMTKPFFSLTVKIYSIYTFYVYIRKLVLWFNDIYIHIGMYIYIVTTTITTIVYILNNYDA